MNTTIRDRRALETLRPFEVTTYLRSGGWTLAEDKEKYSVWCKKVESYDEKFEVILPLDDQYRDFALRMSDLLHTLSVAEARGQTEIFSDIQTASADVVRVRYQREDSRDGTIALNQGETLVENAREMMLAAACATLEPRAYFATRRPDRATEYIQNLRLGASEVGSYVLRILSPVAPHLAVQQTLFGEPEPPYERKVTRHLVRGLLALRKTADEAMSKGTLDHFQEVVNEGVSANLCSSLVRMAGQARTAADSLTISVSWARSRPDDLSIPREIVFPGDRFPVIEEAARWFRASEPSGEIEVRGVVVGLKRKDETGPLMGPITLWTVMDGKPRKLQMELATKDHQIAVRAYYEGATVVCTGRLARSGQLLTLQNPRHFTIVADTEEDD